jgi:hypothetical protein
MVFLWDNVPIQTTRVMHVNLLIDDLQQWPRQVGAVTLGDFTFGAAPRVLGVGTGSG